MSKENLKSLIESIRLEIGHKDSEVNLQDVIFDSKSEDLLIITPDRPDKSAVIGKGGWVVGKLKEHLNINNIHVEAYTDIIVREYRMKLALTKIQTLLNDDMFRDPLPITNLQNLLSAKIAKISQFDFLDYFNLEFNEATAEVSDIDLTTDLSAENVNVNGNSNSNSNDYGAVVALSGGVDSSFALIMAKYLDFNPLAVTVDPGSIVLPRHFKENVNDLVDALQVDHTYLDLDFSDFVQESFEGRFHPCGRCSKILHSAVIDYAKENNIQMVIFGDLVSTGCQSIIYKDGLIRINLPALLGVAKQEIKKVTTSFGVKKSSTFGCPLLAEVQKKFPHMRRYSIQRVLRETRSGALEPGEALDLIWSLCKDK